MSLIRRTSARRIVTIATISFLPMLLVYAIIVQFTQIRTFEPIGMLLFSAAYLGLPLLIFKLSQDEEISRSDEVPPAQ